MNSERTPSAAMQMRSSRQRRWCGTTWPPSARVKSRYEKAWNQKAADADADGQKWKQDAQNGLTGRRDGHFQQFAAQHEEWK